MRELSSTRRGSVFLPMPLDPPLVLTHDHDPDIVFRGQCLVQHPQSPLSYDDLRSKSHHLSLVYHDLLSRHRILADAHQALKAEHSVLRSSYASLASKHQEYVDDAINSRIQSWRYVVRVEELEKELRLLRQGNAHSMCVCCARFAFCAYCSFQNEQTQVCRSRRRCSRVTMVGFKPFALCESYK